MRKRDDLTFPFVEYERRLKELRERMAERRLDAVVITDPENLMYLTDYQTTGYSFFQALVVPLESDAFMITRAMEESNVHARTWVDKTRPYPDTGDAIQMLVESLREFGLNDKNIGYERNSYFFPAYHQDSIHTTLLDGRLLDCFGIVEEGRVCKSEYEIDIMKRAAAATEAGMKAGLKAAAAGVTENDIGAAICSGMFRAGGEPPAVLPYVTSGPRSMIGHATWEGRTVQPGEHVFLEVGGCYRRYHTAMMRTVVLGKLSPSMHHAQERMKQALHEIKAAIGPGMTVSDADNLVRNIISRKHGDARVLREGMVCHIIPWMWGVDGDKTVGISDTIHLTADGCKSFFTLDEDFVVKEDQGAVELSFDNDEQPMAGPAGSGAAVKPLHNTGGQ